MKKERLDILLVEKGLCSTIEKARSCILAGEVWASEERLVKAGSRYPVELNLEIRSRQPDYSSRGGHKLDHALKVFGLSVADRVCIDVGASTGGFTDCLLKAGAKRVFAVDVGYGLLDHKLRVDKRVALIEKTNARYLTLADLMKQGSDGEEISLLVADVSFISLIKVIEPLSLVLKRCEDWVLLFKPQFEVAPEHIKKGGIVIDQSVTKKALDEFDMKMKELGFKSSGTVEPSPIKGKKSGNVEYLLHYTKE